LPDCVVFRILAETVTKQDRSRVDSARGNCRSGKLGLAEVVSNRGDLIVLGNAIRARHNLLAGEDPGSRRKM
jgi:hypothetical protein